MLPLKICINQLFDNFFLNTKLDILIFQSLRYIKKYPLPLSVGPFNGAQKTRRVSIVQQRTGLGEEEQTRLSHTLDKGPVRTLLQSQARVFGPQALPDLASEASFSAGDSSFLLGIKIVFSACKYDSGRLTLRRLLFQSQQRERVCNRLLSRSQFGELLLVCHSSFNSDAGCLLRRRLSHVCVIAHASILKLR